MDINDKFLQLPKAIVESYYEDENKVIIEGKLKVSYFERNFRKTTRAAPLSAEKAVYLALQVPVKPLKSIQDALN